MRSISALKLSAILTRAGSTTALAIALVAPSVAWAAEEQQAGDQAAQTAEEEAAGGIREIVVTARKTAERVQDVPVAITAVDAGLIEDRSLQSVADLEQVTPNLTFSTPAQNSFTQAASVRGVSSVETLLVSQSSVGIYVDDVYQATTLIAGAMDTFDLDRVEVLKGPQGTLYGRNTTAGAILIHSKQPDYTDLSAKVSARYGNYDEFQVQTAINIPAGDSAAVRLNGSYLKRGDGFSFDRSNNRNLAEAETKSIKGAFRATLFDDLEVTLRADYSKSDGSGYGARLLALNTLTGAGPTAGAILAAIKFGFLTPAQLAPGALTFAQLTTALNAGRDRALSGSRKRSFEYDPGVPYFEHNKIHGFSGTLTYNLNDDIQLKSITAWRGFRFDYNNECCDASSFAVISNASFIFGIPAAFYDYDNPGSRARFNQFSQELQLTGRAVDNRLTYAVGGYYFNSDGRDVNQPIIAPALGGTLSVTDGTIFDESIAGYGQASFEVVDNLRVTAGIRYTDEEVQLDSRNRTVLRVLTPTAALICDVPAAVRVNGQCLSQTKTKFTDWAYTFGVDYKINPLTMVYFRTGNGFKAGGINERGNNGVLPFAPEDVTDYEIGIKTDLLDRRLRINAAGFIQRFKGFQEQTVFAPPGGGITSAVFNVDSTGKTNRVDLNGFEVDVTARPIDALTLTAAYGHVSPKFKSNTQPLNVNKVITGTPENTFNASANLELPVGATNTLSFFVGYSWQDDVEFQPNSGFLLPDGTKFGNGASGQKAYGLVDGRITLDFKEHDMQVSVYGKNLTNKYYFVGSLDLSGSLGPITAFEGNPRQYGVQVTKTF